MPHPAVPPEADRLPRDQVVGLTGVVVLLTVAAAAVGGRRWPLPERATGGWGVAAVPPSIAALLVATAVLCVTTATVLTFRVTRLRPAMRTGLAWLGIVLPATAVLAWHVLVMAANGGAENFGPYIPVLDWAFTMVPALLAGRVTARRGAPVAALSALGTAVATLPLYTLAIALLGSRDPFGGYLWPALWAAVAFGAVPLALAVAASWSFGRRYDARATSLR